MTRVDKEELQEFDSRLLGPVLALLRDPALGEVREMDDAQGLLSDSVEKIIHASLRPCVSVREL